MAIDTTVTPGTLLLLFDEADLLERFDDDAEFAQSILEESLNEIPRLLEELQKFCRAGDCSSVRNQAHTLKGMAANISTPRLQDVAMRMEHAARDGQLMAAVELLPEIEQVAQQTADTIKGLSFMQG
jgi:HPt (histidine-containing phosphotransfer) domain-containing protein